MGMNALKDWQTALQQSILERCNRLEDRVRPGGLDEDRRLEIYQNAYLLRLLEALTVNYPGLAAWLGEDALGRLMLEYLEAHPPRAASIRWFGDNLPAYLQSRTPREDFLLLTEMAAFEWALRHTVDAADAVALTPGATLQWASDWWNTQALQRHPSVSRLSLTLNTPFVVQALEAGRPVPEAVEASSDWLIYRDHHGQSRWRSLDSLESLWLDRLATPQRLVDLIPLVGEGEIEALAEIAARLLKTHLDEGLLIVPWATEDSDIVR